MPSLNTSIPVDPVLTSFSLEFRNDRMGLTAPFIFPPVSTNGKKTGTYFTYDRRNRFQVPVLNRAPQTAYKRVSWDVSTSTYNCQDYGARDGWDDSERDAALAPLDLPRDTTEVVTDLTLLAYERRVHAIVTDNTVITQTAAIASANRWNATGGGNPYANVTTGVETIEVATGASPNRIVWGNEVWRDGLQNNANVIDRVKYVQIATPQNINPSLVARSFDLAEGMTSKFIYETSAEGQATLTMDYSFGANVLIFFAAPRPSVKAQTLGVTFQRRDLEVRQYREDAIKTMFVDASHEVDEVTISANMGYLLTTVVDT